jgi:hypothetical protein
VERSNTIFILFVNIGRLVKRRWISLTSPAEAASSRVISLPSYPKSSARTPMETDIKSMHNTPPAKNSHFGGNFSFL